MWRSVLLTVALVAAACREDTVTSTAPELVIAPEVLSFGELPVGGGGTQQLTIRNVSRFAFGLRLQTDSPFRAPTELELAAGESRTLSVWFEPRALGSAQAALAITAEGRERSVRLEGIGTAPPDCRPGPCAVAVGVTDGRCQVETLPDGTACQAPCLRDGVCASGQCRGSELSCDDGNLCTIDACDPLTGCVHAPETCDAPLNPCIAGTCDPKVGCISTAVADGTSCGPNDCTQARVCIDGACTTRPSLEGSQCGDPSPCQPPGICRNGACDRPEAITQRRVWRYSADWRDHLHASEVDGQGRMFIAHTSKSGDSQTYRSRVTGVDVGTGATLVDVPLPVESVDGQGMLSAGGRLFVSSRNEALAFDASSGALLWRSDLYAALKHVLEPWRGKYPLYGVQFNGFVQRTSSILEVLVDGEALDEFGHVVWLGHWWVELDPSTGAVLKYVRLGHGNADLLLHDGSGTVFIAAADRTHGSTLKAITPSGAVTTLATSPDESFRLNDARAGRLLVGRGTYSDAVQLLFSSPSGQPIEVMGNTQTASSNFSAAVGRRLGFVRGDPSSGSSAYGPELFVVDLSNGVVQPSSPLAAGWSGRVEFQSQLEVLADDRVVFSAFAYTLESQLELRGMGADGSRFACPLELGDSHWEVRVAPDRWIGIGAGVEAFDVPGLEPLRSTP